MAKHRATRRNLQRGGRRRARWCDLGHCAAAIGIGASQADESTLAHPVTAFAQLLSGPSDTGVDAFTLGPYTFDPYTTPLGLLASVRRAGPPSRRRCSPVRRCLISPAGIWTELASPLRTSRCSTPAARKSGPSAPPGPYLQVLGMDSYEFTVTSSTPVLLGSAANLPAVGTVYDIFNGYFAGIPEWLLPVPKCLRRHPGRYRLGLRGAAVRPVQPGQRHSGAARLRHTQPIGAVDSELRPGPAARRRVQQSGDSGRQQHRPRRLHDQRAWLRLHPRPR